MQKRSGIFSSGTETRTGAVKRGNTETLALQRGMLVMDLWNCRAGSPSRATGQVQSCCAESIKAKSASLTMDNL